MPLWAVWLFGIIGSLGNAILEGLGAYEAGKTTGRLQAELQAAAGTIAAQQQQLERVRIALAVRHRIDSLGPADTERLRQWYAAQRA